jgi:hypothetical protein
MQLVILLLPVSCEVVVVQLVNKFAFEKLGVLLVKEVMLEHLFFVFVASETSKQLGRFLLKLFTDELKEERLNLVNACFD